MDLGLVSDIIVTLFWTAVFFGLYAGYGELFEGIAAPRNAFARAVLTPLWYGSRPYALIKMSVEFWNEERRAER